MALPPTWRAPPFPKVPHELFPYYQSSFLSFGSSYGEVLYNTLPVPVSIIHASPPSTGSIFAVIASAAGDLGVSPAPDTRQIDRIGLAMCSGGYVKLSTGRVVDAIEGVEKHPLAFYIVPE